MKSIFALLLIVILCSTKTDENKFDEYQGGRFGYAYVSLKLYKDSTFAYTEWNHTGSIKDSGIWQKNKQYFYLNSNSMTSWTTKQGKSDMSYRFKMQKFTIVADTLKLIAKNRRDTDYFDTYYKLYKVANGN